MLGRVEGFVEGRVLGREEGLELGLVDFVDGLEAGFALDPVIGVR